MLTLSRDTLLKPLQMVIGVIEKHQTMPILSNARLSFEQNQLEIIGSDMEVELIGKTQLEEAINAPLELTVPGRTLLDICRNLPRQAPVELYLENHHVVVRSGHSRFSLACLPPEDFPRIDDKNINLSFDIEQSRLLQLLKLTHFAMAQQDVRYYLNGVLLEFQGNTLRAVATDGHRININTDNIDLNIDHRMQIILPRKGVIELMRLLEDGDDNIKILISNNHLRAETSQFTFTSKLIEGRYPDYQPIFSTQCKHHIDLPIEKLKEAIQRCAILSENKEHVVLLQFRENNLKISSNNARQESGEEEISIKYTDGDIDICFNIKYLMDILQNAPGDTLRANLTDSTSYVLFEVPNDDSHLFVIMPIRT